MTWPGRGSLRRIVGWAPPSRAGYRQEGRAAWDARRPRPPSAVVEGCRAVSTRWRRRLDVRVWPPSAFVGLPIASKVVP